MQIVAMPCVSMRSHNGERSALPEALICEGPGKSPAAQRIVTERLSPREIEILESVSCGRSSKQISARLGIGLTTVNWHISNALEKLAAASRTEAVAIAIREGLIVSCPVPSSGAGVDAEAADLEVETRRSIDVDVVGLRLGQIRVTTTRHTPRHVSRA